MTSFYIYISRNFNESLDKISTISIFTEIYISRNFNESLDDTGAVCAVNYLHK